jgi:hypothetical protein
LFVRRDTCTCILYLADAMKIIHTIPFERDF